MRDERIQYLILQNFIVFEGLDGAGTTTQTEKLAARLSEAGLPVDTDREPTVGAIGQLIRSVLQGQTRVDPCSLALLFAADRNEHLYTPNTGVVPRLEAGRTIVCDRYVHSSLAYQGVACGRDLVGTANAAFPFPGHVFYLDVPVSVCLERISDRSHKEIFEKEKFLEAVSAHYTEVLENARNNGVTVHILDGTASSEEISARIWRTVVETPILSV